MTWEKECHRPEMSNYYNVCILLPWWLAVVKTSVWTLPQNRQVHFWDDICCCMGSCGVLSLGLSLQSLTSLMMLVRSCGNMWPNQGGGVKMWNFVILFFFSWFTLQWPIFHKNCKSLYIIHVTEGNCCVADSVAICHVIYII